MAVVNYEKRLRADDDGYEIFEIHHDGNAYGPISEGKKQYIKWLSDGKDITEIPYVPPPLPAIEEYKSKKIEELQKKSAQLCEEFEVKRTTDGRPEKLNQNVRITLLAEMAEITSKRANGEMLTSDEIQREGYLRNVFSQIKPILAIEKQKIEEVLDDNITTHPQVDAITW